MDIGPEFDIGPMDMDPGGFDVPAPGFDDIGPAPPDLPMEDAGSFDRPLPDWDQGPEAILPDNLDVVPEEPVPLPFVELQPVDEPAELAPDVISPDTMDPPVDVSVPSIKEPFPAEEELPNTIVSPESSPEEEILPPTYQIAPVDQVDLYPNSSAEIDTLPETIEPADYSLTPEDLVSNPAYDSLPDQPSTNGDGDAELPLSPIPEIETLPETMESSEYPIVPDEVPAYQSDEIVPDQVPSGDVSPDGEIIVPAYVAPESIPDGSSPNAADIPSGLPDAEIEPDVVQEPAEDEAAYVGPEQTEIYHSPEDTREIQPGVGPNPSWDSPPDAESNEPVDETVDPTNTTLEEPADEILPAEEPQEIDVVEDDGQTDAVLPPSDVTDEIRQVGEPEGMAEFWQEQAGPNDCALYAQGSILEAFGQEFDLDRYQQQGIEAGWYSPDGGTNAANFGDLLEQNGVPITRYDEGSTFQDVATELEAGHGVLVPVDCLPLWGQSGGHALCVTGLEVGPDGVPTAVICNDSGRPDGQKIAYPFEDFKAAWEPFNGMMVATKDPLPALG